MPEPTDPLREALALVRELTAHEDQPCVLDHHGNCQEHGWFMDDGDKPGDCVIPRARAALAAAPVEPEPRRMTTPFDDPIVQACIDHGGHFWPSDAPDHAPATCTRCWYNPGWVAGATPNECPPAPVRDEPQA